VTAGSFVSQTVGPSLEIQTAQPKRSQTRILLVGLVILAANRSEFCIKKEQAVVNRLGRKCPILDRFPGPTANSDGVVRRDHDHDLGRESDATESSEGSRS
jgi:hypothetical protein